MIFELFQVFHPLTSVPSWFVYGRIPSQSCFTLMHQQSSFIHFSWDNVQFLLSILVDLCTCEIYLLWKSVNGSGPIQTQNYLLIKSEPILSNTCLHQLSFSYLHWIADMLDIVCLTILHSIPTFRSIINIWFHCSVEILSVYII